MTYPTEWLPVPPELDEPAEVYETRAAVDGVDWAEATLATVGAAAVADPALTFFPDVSQFQPPVDTTFRSPILSFRICDGDYFDLNAVANWRAASQMLNDPNHPLQLVWVYFFYRPGTWASVDSYIKRVFGSPSFPDRVAAMIDCEGWGGQIVGDHSVELNLWADRLAARTTSGQASVVGYSYTSAFNEIWPAISPWIKRHTASYGGWDPGWYGWQYSGGTGTGGRTGWAHGASPWPLCDMNVIQRPIGQILTDFGFTTEDDLTPDEHTWLSEVHDRLLNVVLDPTGGHPMALPNIRGAVDRVAASVDTVEPSLAALSAKVDALATTGAVGDVNKAIRDALNATKLVAS